MGFMPQITIIQAMNYIDSKDYLLPAFQREFTWKAEQIEKLFDSLMRKYPTSTMLFWKVKGETRTSWKFYEFLNSFVMDANDKIMINELYNTNNKNDFWAILDGQQRLTALKLGLYGTYSYHEARKSWSYSPISFPTRRLYLNLTTRGGTDSNTDSDYIFKFLKDDDTKSNVFYKDPKNNLWLKVSEIINFHKSEEEIIDYFNSESLNNEQRKIIRRLDNMVFNDTPIMFYEEDEQIPDKAVTIFTRINSGGTHLSFSDIVFSLMVSNWSKDARTEINELISAIQQKGFDIDKDYIIKSFLYLFNNNVQTQISSFTKEFCKKIENNWEGVRDTIISLFDLLKSFGLTSFSLTSNNATLPILYYLYHKDIYKDYRDKVEFKVERQEIKKWLLGAILRQTFGGQSDSTLQQTRKFFTDDIKTTYLPKNIEFSGAKINSNIKNFSKEMDDETISKLLSTQKDNKYAFPILALLYPNLDYKNNNFHKDHLHPETLYDSLPSSTKDKYPFKVYNSILNLQMLDKNENESKSSKTLKNWVDETCKNMNEEMKAKFLENHLIPDVDLSIDNFDNYIKEREKILRSKLKEIL